MYQIEEQQADNSAVTHNVLRFDDSILPEQTQGAIERSLQRGAENSILADDLRRKLGIKERNIRHLIAAERANGAVILSGKNGYYLPDHGEKGRRETAEFIASITARGIKTIQAADSAKAFLDKLPGQVEIGGGTGEQAGDDVLF